MTIKRSHLISRQIIGRSAPLNQLIADYGDNLELLAADEKLHLISVLSFWQAIDTERQATTKESESYTLAEAIEDYATDLSGDALAALKCLQGIEVRHLLGLLCAVTNQLRDGVFQQ